MRHKAMQLLRAARRDLAAAKLAVVAAAQQGDGHRRPVYLDPVEYAAKELGIILTAQQIDIVRALRKPPYMVAVDSGNNQGKTLLAAVLVNWWYDTFRESSCVITTASSAEHVTSVLWGEIRRLRTEAGLPGFETRAVAPELRDGPSHYAKGISTDRQERLKGRHLEHMLFVIDEAVGVEQWVFDAIRTMFQRDGKHAWLALCNPTDTTSAMYAEEQITDLADEPVWNRFVLDAREHPNVIADLHTRGRQLLGLPDRCEPRIPGAVRLHQFEDWLAAGCEAIQEADATALDVQWPPLWWRAAYAPDKPAQWWRCGPEFEAVGLGRWPSQSSGSVWSEAAWQAALRPCYRAEIGYWLDGGQPRFPGEVIGQGVLRWRPEIGCDPARFGRNYTAIMVRVGPHALAFEQHNGWDSVRTTGRLKELAREWAEWATLRGQPHAAPVEPKQIKVKVDSDGLGGPGVIDWADPGWQKEFNFVGISAASPPVDALRYLNKRSELWFRGPELAKMGQMDLSRLPRKALQVLRIQAMAPQWKMDGVGHRVVERKEDLEKRGGKSPDAMDALNLTYWEGAATGMSIETEASSGIRPQERAESEWDDAEETAEADLDRPALYRGRRR